MDEIRKRIEESKERVQKRVEGLLDREEDKGKEIQDEGGLRGSIRRSREFVQESVNKGRSRYEETVSAVKKKRDVWAEKGRWVRDGYRTVRDKYPWYGIVGSTTLVGCLSYPIVGRRYALYRNVFVTGVVSTMLFSPSTLPYLFDVGRSWGQDGGGKKEL